MGQNKKKVKITPCTVTFEEFYFQNICCSGAIYNHNTVVSSTFIEYHFSGIWLTSWSMNGMFLWTSNQALYWLHHCPLICLSLKLIFIKSMEIDAREYWWCHSSPLLIHAMWKNLLFPYRGYCWFQVGERKMSSDV